jgi:hypothetical protein
MPTFQDIWNNLTSPPSWGKTFFLVALAAVVAFSALSWRYQGQIESLNQEKSLLNQENSSLKDKTGQDNTLTISKKELTNILSSRMALGIADLDAAADNFADKPNNHKNVMKIRDTRKTYEKLMQDAIAALEKDQLNVFYEKFRQINALLYSAEFKKLFPKTEELAFRVPGRGDDSNHGSRWVANITLQPDLRL